MAVSTALVRLDCPTLAQLRGPTYLLRGVRARRISPDGEADRDFEERRWVLFLAADRGCLDRDAEKGRW